MSLGNFIKKLWLGIKVLFAGMPKQVKTAIHIGVVVVENLKKVTDSPVADILTAIIPGDIDDLIKQKLRQYLPVILQKLKLADATLSLNDPQAILQTALQSFAELDPEIKPATLHSLSILIAQCCADGELSWSDGVYVLEWYYKNQYEPAA